MHAMVVELTGGRALPAELEAQIGARTDGVPLFVEEITHAVLESGWIEEASSGLVTSGLAAGTARALDPARVAARAARRPRRGARRRAGAFGRGPRGSVRAAACGLRAGRQRARGRTRPPRRPRPGAPPPFAGRDELRAQALARAGRGLRVAAAQLAPPLPRARRRGAPAELPEVVETQPEFVAHHLLRGRAGRRRDRLPPARRRACAPPLGEHRGDPAPGAARSSSRGAARLAGPAAARADAPDRAGRAADRGEGLQRAGGRGDLHAGRRAVPRRRATTKRRSSSARSTGPGGCTCCAPTTRVRGSSPSSCCAWRR